MVLQTNTLTVAVLLLMLTRGSFGQDLELSDILRTWQERQERYPSIIVKWGGEIIAPETEISQGKQRDVIPAPTESVSNNLTKELRFEGLGADRVFFSRSGSVRNGQTGKMMDGVLSYAFDGSECSSLTQLEKVKMSQGDLLSADGRQHHFADLELRAILMFFRPLTARMGGSETERLSIGNEIAEVDGQEMVVLKGAPTETSPLIDEFWLDPRNDFVVTRYLDRRQDGSIRHQIDINYEEKDGHGSLPASWKIVSTSREGNVSTEFREQIQSIELNPLLTDEHFQIQFPPNTLIVDSRSQDPLYYQMTATGTKRKLDAIEATSLWKSGIADEVFPDNNTSNAATTPPSPWRGWLLIANIGLICGILLFLKRRKRMKS